MSPQVNLAGHQVGQVGFGLMQLTWTPEPVEEEVAFAAMKQAADSGATAWSTATFYGNPGSPDANLKLIGKFFSKYPEYKSKIVIILKGGSTDVTKEMTAGLDRNREMIKHATELIGKTPEVYSLGRLPPDLGFEEVFENMKVLMDEGLFGAFGASEMKRESLERAHKIIPISYVETEVSLWSYEPEIRSVIDWSAQNKIPTLAYSPLGRGFITRKWKSPEDVPPNSFQGMSPRFQGEAFYENLKIVDELDRLAEEKGLETSQLALAWVVGLSPYVIPIPGSSNAKRVKQNTEAADIKLSEEDLKEINRILAEFEPKGGRYPDHSSGLLMQ